MSSKQEFLEAKAENFKKFLLQYEPNDASKELMDNFDKTKLVPTILTQLVPLVNAGLHTKIVAEITKGLTIPEGKEKEVESKILKYFEMFCDVVVN
jgi:hypothetical protein